MGQKGHIMDQQGLKMHDKRQKIEFLDLKNLLFSGIGGYPAPLNGQSLCSRKLYGQNPLKQASFWGEVRFGIWLSNTTENWKTHSPSPCQFSNFSVVFEPNSKSHLSAEWCLYYYTHVHCVSSASLLLDMQTLCSKSEQKFSFLTKPQLRNLQQIVANTILISNSYNINKFWVGIFTRQGYISKVSTI